MNFHKLSLLVGASFLVSACSSTDTKLQSNMPVIPGWVSTPTIDGGFASSACVIGDADYNILKQKGTAIARADLEQTINTAVKGVENSFVRLTDTSREASSANIFKIGPYRKPTPLGAGSRLMQVDFVELEDVENLCVMVGLSPELAESIFDNLINKLGQNVSPQDKEILYDRFLAQQTVEKMDAEFDKE